MSGKSADVVIYCTPTACLSGIHTCKEIAYLFVHACLVMFKVSSANNMYKLQLCVPLHENKPRELYLLVDSRRTTHQYAACLLEIADAACLV